MVGRRGNPGEQCVPNPWRRPVAARARRDLHARVVHVSHIRAHVRRQGSQAGLQAPALVRVERADRVGKGQSPDVVRDHTACSICWRMAIIPARMRVFTVPSGNPKRCASSL